MQGGFLASEGVYEFPDLGYALRPLALRYDWKLVLTKFLTSIVDHHCTVEMIASATSTPSQLVELADMHALRRYNSSDSSSQ